MSARVERVVTTGVSAADENGDRPGNTDGTGNLGSTGNSGNTDGAGTVETVETNAWIVGDDDEVIVVDAGHDPAAILEAVGDREILAVICTHGLADHVGAALEVAERDEAPIALHEKDRGSWQVVHPDDEPDIDIEDGGIFGVAGVELEVLHTPGHTPGGVSLYCEELEVVFVGDTLPKGGPVADGTPSADFPTLLTSIGARLLTLPPDTRVCGGHGEETTVATEEPDFDVWVTRSR